MRHVRLIILLVAVLGAAGYFGYRYLWLADDERILHGKVDKLVELAEKEGEETLFSSIGTAREIAGHFTEEFVVSMGRPFPEGRQDRDEFAAVIHQARSSAGDLRFRVSDRDLVVAEDGGSAVMELTGHGIARFHEHGRRDESRRFRVEWIKEEGDWLISRVELIDILD